MLSMYPVNLVVYPAANANTFVSLEEANVFINTTLGYASWQELSDDDKSRWLIYAYNLINLIPTFVPPIDLTGSCLPAAQSFQAIYTLMYGLDSAEGDQQVRIDKVGPLSTEYFKNEQLDRLSINDFPPTVVNCLKNYGVVESPNYVDGVGSFSRTR